MERERKRRRLDRRHEKGEENEMIQEGHKKGEERVEECVVKRDESGERSETMEEKEVKREGEGARPEGGNECWDHSDKNCEEREKIEDNEKDEDVEDALVARDDECSVSDAEIDFYRVVQLMKEEVGKNPRPNVAQVQRSVTQCRNKFLTSVSPSINQAAFTHEESLKILEIVHTYSGHPPWDVVANRLNTLRTPFQCFRHYRTKFDVKTCRPWTRYEDELLLKYMATSGPQFVLNKAKAADLARRFFPDRSVRQVMLRAHSSLVNVRRSYDSFASNVNLYLVLENFHAELTRVITDTTILYSLM